MATRFAKEKALLGAVVLLSLTGCGPAQDSTVQQAPPVLDGDGLAETSQATTYYWWYVNEPASCYTYENPPQPFCEVVGWPCTTPGAICYEPSERQCPYWRDIPYHRVICG